MIEDQLRKIVGERLLLNEPLSRHVNFRIGGPADFFVEAKTKDEIAELLRVIIENKQKYFILGGGANLLVADQGFRGLVIKIACREFSFHDNRLTADSGAPMSLLAREAANRGLVGIEWAIGIPGTLGGAVRGNAGSFNGEIKDSIESVEALFAEDNRIERRWLKRDECGFGYRDSIFKRIEPAPVILSADFALKNGKAEEIMARQSEIMEKRKGHQPLNFSSAGCVFKNIELTGAEDLSKLKQDADIPENFIAKKRIPAGWLIEQAGLKGTSVGQARVSDEHGNFCLNMAQATAAEVVELVSLVKTRIRDRYGLELKEEIQYLGF